MTLANEQNGSSARSDERLKKVSTMTALARRPELGAVAGLVVVTIFFFSTANPAIFTLAGVVNFMAPAAQLGILAIGAALLMIGGEFDLSIGSMVAFAGLVFGTALVVLDLPLSVAILIALGFAVVIGITGIMEQVPQGTDLQSFHLKWPETISWACHAWSKLVQPKRLPRGALGPNSSW
jgi:simple sugar transport system permease protein